MNLKVIPTPEFIKQVKKLSKSFKLISKDLKRLESDLNQNPKIGTDLGNNCYKIRIPNSSIPTGKSGGFRVITYYIDSKALLDFYPFIQKLKKKILQIKKFKRLLRII